MISQTPVAIAKMPTQDDHGQGSVVRLGKRQRAHDDAGDATEDERPARAPAHRTARR